MRKVLIKVLLVGIILVGCSKTKELDVLSDSYKIIETSKKNWKFSGGEFLEKGEKQEFNYSKVEYIGTEDFTLDTIFIEFYINKKATEEITNASKKETILCTYSEGSNEGVIINSYYSIEAGGIEGQLLENGVSYNYDSINMKISYDKNGKYCEEVLALPMKKVVFN